MEVLFLCIMLAMVAIGVNFFVTVGIPQASFEKLLQEGDYTVEKKTKTSVVAAVSTIY